MKYLAMVCLIFLTASIALPSEASPESLTSNLRCGQYIIVRGVRQSEVLRKCGNPNSVEMWEKEGVKRNFYRDIPAQSDEELSQEPLFLREQIWVEEWEYNFGPTRFLYYLRFENGRLIRITVGDYGY